MPEGIRWNLNSSPSRTIVWPALLPPWKRTIAAARSASRSVTLPLPSSPHWAPTMTSPGIAERLWRFERLGDLAVAAVAAEECDLVADLVEPGNRTAADLLLQLLVRKIGRDQHRALRLVALVDQGVELLQHPVAALLGAEVVDVEQVDRGEALEEGKVGVAARFGVVGAADAGEQLGQRVDRHRATGLKGRLGDEHRQGRLAGAGVAEEPEPAASVEALVELVDEAAHLGHGRLRLELARHVGDRRAVEGDTAVARRDNRGDAFGPPSPHPRSAALAFACDVFRPEDPAGAVADAERAGLFAEGLAARDRHQNSGPAAAASSSGGPSPAGCSIGRSWPAKSANFGKRSRKTSFGEPIGPFLCLAMIRSARPSGSSSGSR